ncbi:MAG: SCO family protein [Ktedonobacterales bacterium]
MQTMRLRLISRMVVVALVVVVVAIALIHQHLAVDASSPHTAPALTGGAVLSDMPAAPTFTLMDQNGQTIALNSLRGRPVVITFIDTTCTQECPIIAQYLDDTAYFMKTSPAQVEWLAISVNPTNTPASAHEFLTKNKVTIPLHVLLGSQAQLSAIWKAYHIQVIPTPTDVQHTSGLYMLDKQGRERLWMDAGFDPTAAARDLGVLLTNS